MNIKLVTATRQRRHEPGYGIPVRESRELYGIKYIRMVWSCAAYATSPRIADSVCAKTPWRETREGGDMWIGSM